MDKIGQLNKKLKKIKCLLLDVDGVLTDGRIAYDSEGRDSKFFDVHDGLGVSLLGRMGIKTALISAKHSKTLAHRARDMKCVKVFGGILPKSKVYVRIKKQYNLHDEEICFMGDDLVDLCVLKSAGLAVAPKNAVFEVKKIAHYVTKKQGGRGAVRELAEMILKSKGLWQKALMIYQ